MEGGTRLLLRSWFLRDYDAYGGVVSVEFPTEDTWERDAPVWAKPYWEAVRNQLTAWCDSQKIPLYTGPYGNVC